MQKKKFDESMPVEKLKEAEERIPTVERMRPKRGMPTGAPSAPRDMLPQALPDAGMMQPEAGDMSDAFARVPDAGLAEAALPGAALPGALPDGRSPAAGMPGEPVGVTGRIGKEEIAKAQTMLEKYRRGKTALEQRIVQNEQWYKIRNWEQIGHSKNKGDPEPVSAWLFNSLSNKHADAMDNYPAPNVLPREASDEQTATALGSILPAVLEQNRFEQTYSDVWWYKLKSGTGVYGVFWEPGKENGLGDIDIRKIDLLNLFWEPGVGDIQKSRNLFSVELVDRDIINELYPHADVTGNTLETTKYHYDDSIDTSDKAAVVDWYYKRREPNGKTTLHYCKYCAGQVLYASENDPQYSERGYYDHGKYPFVFDVLFPVEGSPAGFGYIDVCRSPQMYIDKLDQAILKNTVLGARPRFWQRQDGEVNAEEYADLSRDFVHYTGSGNPNESIAQIPVPELNPYAVTIRTAKIDELKETSGNRDFQQGGASGGITAASAISALQEAGSKLSRDMIKASYRAHAEIGYFVIELIRQFYNEPRVFRVVGEDGANEFVEFSGAEIAPESMGNQYGIDLGERVPVYDIKVSAQKSSPFATVAQNERAKELYGMGFFNPQMADQALAALEIMQFEGIEKVRKRIGDNGTMEQKLQQVGQIAMAMAQQLDAMTGSGYTMQIAQLVGMEGAMPPTGGGGIQGDMGVNALGDTFAKSKAQTASAARNDAAGKSTPK